MRGFRLISLEIGEDQKKGLHVRRLLFFPPEIGEGQKKRSSMFVMRPLIFSEALDFSLLSLYVNPARCVSLWNHLTGACGYGIIV